jgi:hypothetical protein
MIDANIKCLNLIKEQIIFNKTFIYNLAEFSFGNLPSQMIIEIFKDGRPFSHFIEKWLSVNFELIHIGGCKSYDLINKNDENTKYDQKTFTVRGCKFMPSNMIGEGRKFDKEIFETKAQNLNYIIVSNVNFPEIKIKFVRGRDLIIDYPNGTIPSKDFIKFFN